MYRLLIVDDEPVITDGMFELLSADRLLDLDIYKAYSGEEALEWIDRMRVDIVLSDIRMPGIDGLELMSRVKRKWPRCKVVFLTVHSEFSYIYKAVQEKDVSYILKTEPHERIFEEIRACVRDLDQSREIEALLADARERSGPMILLHHQDLVHRLLLSGLPGTIDQLDLDWAKTTLDPERGVLLLLGRQARGGDGRTYRERLHQLDSIRLIAEERFSGNLRYLFGEAGPSELLWVLQSSGTGPEGIAGTVLFVRETLELIQDAFVKLLGKRMSFVLADGEVGWDRIPSRCVAMRRFFDREVMNPEEEIILIDGAARSPSRLDQRSHNLNQIIDRCDGEAFLELVRSLASEAAASGGKNEGSVLESYMKLALALVSCAGANELYGVIASDAALERLLQPRIIGAWSDALDNLRATAEAVFDELSKKEVKRANSAVQRVKSYIDDHLDGDVSLVRLAEEAYFNPAYLSRLFKQVEGITLSDYIDDVRIERATRLLAMPERKIQEVAALVGFESASNFGRFFKRKLALTPQEYRDRK